MSEPVKERWTRAHPCPVCSGWDNPSGRGGKGRCHGFRSTHNLDVVFCAVDESGEWVESLGLWKHRLKDHGGDIHAPTADLRGGRQQSKSRSNGSAEDAPTVVDTIEHPYLDDEGNELLVVLRERMSDGGKSIRQGVRQADGNVLPGRLPAEVTAMRPNLLYRWPETQIALSAGDPVYVLEGESDVDTAFDRFMVATCNIGGTSMDWGLPLSRRFAGVANEGGGPVTVVADNDQPGRKHALQIVNALVGAGVDPGRLSLKVPPSPHNDLRDLIESGGSPDDLCQLELDDQEELAGHTGEGLLELARREPLPPVEPGVPPDGHLTVLIASKGSGKTSLSTMLACARACGVAPWPGAPVPKEPGRVLILSPDEPTEIVAKRAAGMQAFSHGWLFEDAVPRLHVLGPDRDIAGEEIRRVRLDEEGLMWLDSVLLQARLQKQPFAGVHLDAWVNFLPDGVDENSNTECGRVASRLEELAVRHGCYILLLHHMGKAAIREQGSEDLDPASAARGAGALVNSARCVFLLSGITESPHLRILATTTNLGPTPGQRCFEVCSETAASGEQRPLFYFRPSSFADRQPHELIQRGEAITQTELARRLLGWSGEHVEGKRIPGHINRIAHKLMQRWRKEGLVDVVEGKKRLMKLVFGGTDEDETYF